jgi:hypothetical protein
VILHAGLVALRGDGGWRGVLIEGASGAGKSDLALRLLERGWRLVADDRVQLWRSGARLFGRAPDSLHGLIEARGLGVRDTSALRLVEVAFALRHARSPERLPDPEWRDVAGVRLPALALNLLEASAPARLALALGQTRPSDHVPHGLETDPGERIKPPRAAEGSGHHRGRRPSGTTVVPPRG